MDLIHRTFGYCKIQWEINNLCIAACKDSWEVVSPEFYVRGFALTKWRMMLKSESQEDDDSFIIFSLERLECGNNFEKVLANFSLIIDTYQEFPVFESFFEVKSSYKVELEYQSDILNKIFLFRPDVLHFRCELLVYLDSGFLSVEETFDSCSDPSLKQLSRDLFTLYENGYDHNIEIELTERNIRAHKSILYSRSEFFSRKINENPNKAKIDVGIVDDYEALKKVIAFIYTGNLEFVLRKPSISILEYANKFGLSDVIQYYTPDKFTIRSTIDADDYYFTWTIQNFFFRSENHLESPLLTMGKTNITWKLKLYPICYRNNEEWTAVFAEFLGLQTSIKICVEFTLKSSNKYFYPKRSRRTICGEEINVYKKFIKRESLLNCLQAGDLILVYRFRISTGVLNYSLGVSQTSCIYSKQNHYDNLLDSMAFLYVESFMGDVYIRSMRRRFKVHKCILAARSPNIYDMLAGKNYLYLDIESDVLDEILYFLYTATFRDENPNIGLIFQMYKSAEKFNIKCLKTTCSEILQRSITGAR